MPISTENKRMQQLTGRFADLNTSNMLVGEFAVPNDHNPVIKMDNGKIREIPLLSDMDSYENKIQEVNDAMTKLNNEYESTKNQLVAATKANADSAAKSAAAAATSETNANAYKNNAASSATAAASSAGSAKTSETNAGNYASNASTSATNAKASEANAGTYANNASSSATSAKTYASNASTSASNAKTSETNANAYKNNAASSATAAASSAGSASTYKDNAKTYMDNANAYAKEAKTAASSITGALKPKGTVTFANLPTLSTVEAGAMYNISTAFTSNANFKDGGNITYPAGTNVYKTEDGMWDCLAGELGDYLMKDDIDTAVEESMPDYTASTQLTELVSGEKLSTALGKIKTAVKNVISLVKLLGTTDISKIGNGTVTGAISSLNSNLDDYKWTNWIHVGTVCGIELRYRYNEFQCSLSYSGTISNIITAYSQGYFWNNFPEALMPTMNILVPIVSNQDGLCLRCYPFESKKWYLASMKSDITNTVDTYICGEYTYAHI